jgi:hypothetical protein
MKGSAPAPEKFEGNVPAMAGNEWYKTIQKLGWGKKSGGDYRVKNLDTDLVIATTSHPDKFMIST